MSGDAARGSHGLDIGNPLSGSTSYTGSPKTLPVAVVLWLIFKVEIIFHPDDDVEIHW